MKSKNLIFELIMVVAYNVGIFFDIFKNGFKFYHIIINTFMMLLFVLYFYRYDIKVYDLLDRFYKKEDEDIDDEIEKEIDKEFDVIK